MNIQSVTTKIFALMCRMSTQKHSDDPAPNIEWPRFIALTFIAQLGVCSAPALAELSPGQYLEPLDFNATLIADIAESRTGSGGLSDMVGRIGSEFLKGKTAQNAVCVKARILSVSRRQVAVEIECPVDDGMQLTVAAYSKTDEITANVVPEKVVIQGGLAQATIAYSASTELTTRATSKFLVVNNDNRRTRRLSAASTSLFSMLHEFSQGAVVRPEPEARGNFRQFGIKQRNRAARVTPARKKPTIKRPKYVPNPVRKKQIITSETLFQLPLYDRKFPISFCQSRGRACGKQAADAFCRREGFSRAIGFSERTNIATAKKPAVALSDGSFCTLATCKVLSNVSCARPFRPLGNRLSVPANYTYNNPRSAGYRVDSCLNWGKNCGKPAADTFCKIKGFAASKSHIIAQGVGSTRAPTLVLNSGQTCTSSRCSGFSKIQCTNDAVPLFAIAPSVLPSILKLSYAAKGEAGPSLSNPVSLADISTGNINGVNTDAALPFHHEIWRDTRDASVYYYAPKQFRLSYAQENEGKLGIDVFYGDDRSAEKPVTLTLHFDTGIDQSDVNDLRRLIQNIFAARGEPKNVTLKRFPIRQDPTISFELFPGSGEPRVLALDNDRFSTLDLQWSLEESVWQGWQASLRDQNHSGGSMILTPPDPEKQPSHRIDIVAKVIDPAVYGQDAPDDLSSWTNSTPFPVTLKRLNGLGELNKNPASVSWSLANTKLQPGERIIFDTNEVNFPTNLKQRVIKYWLDYRLDTSCQTCVDSAIPTQSVSSALKRNISFKLPGSYDASAFEEIQIVVRSRYLSPQARSVDTAPMVSLNEPRQEQEIASPLYLPDGRQLSEGGLAEARITVVTAGGERTVSGQWFEITNERTYISTSKIQSVLDAN